MILLGVLVWFLLRRRRARNAQLDTTETAKVDDTYLKSELGDNQVQKHELEANYAKKDARVAEFDGNGSEIRELEGHHVYQPHQWGELEGNNIYPQHELGTQRLSTVTRKPVPGRS